MNLIICSLEGYNQLHGNNSKSIMNFSSQLSITIHPDHIFKLVSNIVTELGPQKIILVVTDTAVNIKAFSDC